MIKPRVAKTMTMPAPVGGIDDTSSLAAMDAKFAVDMLNFFPDSSELRTRHGYQEWVTNLPENGKTIMVYHGSDGFDELFVVTDDGIYDMTASTDTPVLAHALTEGRVNYTMFTNDAGATYLIGCNGVDDAFYYNGTAWASYVQDATPTVLGEIDIDPATLKNVVLHMNRLWFITTDLDAYYLDPFVISGVAQLFPLSAQFKRGGIVSDVFTWTVDNGVGIDDVLVFQNSQGEIIGYIGQDPTSSQGWSLKARFYIGRPLAVGRTNVPLNGDYLMMTEYGMVSLYAVVNGEYQVGVAENNISGRISKSLNRYIRERNFQPEWEVHSAPSMRYIVVNFPDQLNRPGEQYVMNSITGAWARFDLPMLTMKEHSGGIFFTDQEGRVLRYGDVEVDNLDLDGENGVGISAGFQQAYSSLGSDGATKHFKMMRPVFEADANPSANVGLSIDFSPDGITSLADPSGVSPEGSVWDVAVWDVSVWSIGRLSWLEWVGTLGVGYYASLIIRTKTSTSTAYIANTWVYEEGAGI